MSTEIREALVYDPEARSGSGQLDLYLPAERSSSPVLIYLHGGAWVLGHRDDLPDRLEALAEAGVVVASIDYTPVQDSPWPAQRDDIVTAGLWLSSMSSTFGIRTGKLALGGASAGAHLALLSALHLSRPDNSPDLPFAISSAVGYFGNYDLTSTRPAPERGLEHPQLPIDPTQLAALGGALPSPTQRHAWLTGLSIGDVDDAALAGVSPLYRLHSRACPFLLLHGDRDGLVPAEQSRRFVSAAQAVGVSAELKIVAGANHESTEFADPSIARMVAEFLRRS